MLSQVYLVFILMKQKKMYGDERNIKEKRWIESIYMAGGEVIENTGFHYYPLYRRIIEVRKYFRPKAFHLFIVEEKIK